MNHLHAGPELFLNITQALDVCIFLLMYKCFRDDQTPMDLTLSLLAFVSIWLKSILCEGCNLLYFRIHMVENQDISPLISFDVSEKNLFISFSHFSLLWIKYASRIGVTSDSAIQGKFQRSQISSWCHYET